MATNAILNCGLTPVVGRCRDLMQPWGFKQDRHTKCDCGEDPQTMLERPFLPEPCRPNDLVVYNSCLQLQTKIIHMDIARWEASKSNRLCRDGEVPPSQSVSQAVARTSAQRVYQTLRVEHTIRHAIEHVMREEARKHISTVQRKNRTNGYKKS